MAFNPTKRLLKHMDLIFTENRVSSADVMELFRLLRLLIEKNHVRNLYPYTALYCDWAQHDKINRHEVGWQILEDIDVALIDLRDETDMGKLNARISAAFGLGKLRQELIVLFHDQNIRTDIVDGFENWCAVLKMLLVDLDDREICFSDDIVVSPKARGRKVYQRMIERRIKLQLPHDMAVVRAFFLNRSHETPVAGRPSGIYWRVRIKEQSLEHHVEINGQFALPEGRESFKF
ncbi:MAG: hypothetical protein EOP06_03940 [Proteobacteria bacterium]|nr:MAG: hypothetical protein EOP06_03940 [Pseudomonadota bacterium]